MTDAPQNSPIVIVGAGLSGLACGLSLHRAGVRFQILDASDRVGGRVATDEVDGFLLDRGFQVFLTAYPEAANLFDYKALQLNPLYAGALIQLGSRRYRFADPWRNPISAVLSLLAPIAGVRDGWRILQLRRASLQRGDPTDSNDQSSTVAYLRKFGLSERVIERFFRPFFGGVFLDRSLETPSAFFRFVFSMFAMGPATLPSGGMQTLPMQLAAALPDNAVRLNSPVADVSPTRVTLESNERIIASAVVIATDANAAARLTNDTKPVSWNSTTTVYYDAPHSPIRENALVLNGDGRGRVNHVCVPSDAAASYAPKNRSLVSISLIGAHDEDDKTIHQHVMKEIHDWFGPDVNNWRLLRVYRIKKALPREFPADTQRANSNGMVLCGDYTHDPSINGALLSGRRAAEVILARRLT